MRECNPPAPRGRWWGATAAASAPPSRRALIASAGALMSGVGAARAQDFPARPIRLLVGFVPGGPADITARTVAQDMSAALGQPVLVENRPGANSHIATEACLRAAPDGYIIALGTITTTVNPLLMPQVRYEAARDFAPIGLMAMLPLIAVVGGASEHASLDGMLRWGRAGSIPLTYASSGIGSSGHLAGALLSQLSGVPMTHVPFRGQAPALTEVISGRVSFMFYAMVGIADHIAEGRVRAVAVSTPERLPDFPGVPTMRELGFQGFSDYTQGLGLLAPANTPPPVVDRLNAALRLSLANMATEQRLRSLGALVRSSTPAEYADFLRDDAARWGRIIRISGITTQSE